MAKEPNRYASVFRNICALVVTMLNKYYAKLQLDFPLGSLKDDNGLEANV